MLRLGVAIEDTWDFFHDVYAEFSAHHHTSLFERRPVNFPFFRQRLERRVFRQNMQQFLANHDAVFFEWGSQLLATATQLPKSCAIITRMHRYEFYQWAEHIHWPHVDKIILVSHAKQKEFAARFPEHAHKVVVIPESINLARFPLHNGPVSGNIGTLAHLKPRKRVYELILAFSEINRQNSNLRLYIGGDSSPNDEYMQAMLTLVRDLNLQDRVIFDGPITDTPAWYSKIDVFVSNSYSEGLQVSPMEAMASGCYTLSHRWDGADELLPEEYLFFSERELQQKVLDYFAMPADTQSMHRQRQRQRVADNFNAEQIKQEIRKVVEATAAVWLQNAKR